MEDSNQEMCHLRKRRFVVKILLLSDKFSAFLLTFYLHHKHSVHGLDDRLETARHIVTFEEFRDDEICSCTLLPL